MITTKSVSGKYYLRKYGTSLRFEQLREPVKLFFDAVFKEPKKQFSLANPFIKLYYKKHAVYDHAHSNKPISLIDFKNKQIYFPQFRCVEKKQELLFFFKWYLENDTDIDFGSKFIAIEDMIFTQKQILAKGGKK